MTLQTVILAAGMGSRLGRSLPKPLTELADGRSIMQQQHDNVRAAFGDDARITTVATTITTFASSGLVISFMIHSGSVSTPGGAVKIVT